jgi:hypothetical protein
MDFDISKFWIAGFSAALSAIAGAWIWAQRAASIAGKAAQDASDDGLIQAAANTGTASLGAALQGAMVGGVIGLVAAFAYFYFTDPDRGMRVKEVDTGDDRY